MNPFQALLLRQSQIDQQSEIDKIPFPTEQPPREDVLKLLNDPKYNAPDPEFPLRTGNISYMDTVGDQYSRTGGATSALSDALMGRVRYGGATPGFPDLHFTAEDVKEKIPTIFQMTDKSWGLQRPLTFPGVMGSTSPTTSPLVAVGPGISSSDIRDTTAHEILHEMQFKGLDPYPQFPEGFGRMPKGDWDSDNWRESFDKSEAERKEQNKAQKEWDNKYKEWSDMSPFPGPEPAGWMVGKTPYDFQSVEIDPVLRAIKWWYEKAEGERVDDPETAKKAMRWYYKKGHQIDPKNYKSKIRTWTKEPGWKKAMPRQEGIPAREQMYHRMPQLLQNNPGILAGLLSGIS